MNAAASPPQTILITGAASGIGRACAENFAGAGARHLILIDRDGEALASLDLSGVTIDRRVGDVTDPNFWQAAVPPLDAAIIAAGISTAAPLATLDFADWRRTMAVNLDGAMLAMQASLGAMRNNGGLVAISPASGIKAEAGIAAYAASKAGLIQLCKVAAKEVAPRGIRVNCIAPGGVDTPLWDGMDFFAELVRTSGSRDAAIAAIASASPLARMASPGEIAAQAAFLLSSDAASITGAVLTVDAGYSI
jgi:NAD(P)-dependent dehydrogenase (short-subunit alcohol dehydrogenase family)